MPWLEIILHKQACGVSREFSAAISAVRLEPYKAIALALLLGTGCAVNSGNGMDAGVNPPADAGANPMADAGACDGGQVSREVQFPSKDGLMVHGTFVAPCGGAPASTVVLAHQFCSDRSEWSQSTHDWVRAFAQRRIATLAIDLRGHGASTLWPDGSKRDLCTEVVDANVPSPFLLMVEDVKSALAYARATLGATRVAGVGASIGANSVIVAYAADPLVEIIVALSPGLDYGGIQPAASIPSIGARPALLEAANDDGDNTATAVMQFVASNPSVMSKIWPTGGHGNAILAAHPEELTRIADLVASKL